MAVALLVGCQSAMTIKHADLLLPKAKTIGTFVLDGTSPTVDQLLSRFRERAPAAFQSKGLDQALFDKDEGLQWAVLSFKQGFIHWKLVVQFVRRPTETGDQVLALVRTTGTMDGQGPDPEKLNPILPVVLEALQAAQAP